MSYEEQTDNQELENEEQARQLESLTDRWYVAVFPHNARTLLFFNYLFQNKKVALVRCCSQESLTLFSKQTKHHRCC